MPIDSARRTSAFASYRPKAASLLPAKSGRFANHSERALLALI